MTSAVNRTPLVPDSAAALPVSLAAASKIQSKHLERLAIIYDPNDANDRLLLGLKGTISEVELHILRQRLDRGRLNKAQRGALLQRVPLGYERSRANRIELDSDEQVRATVMLLFDKFDELG